MKKKQSASDWIVHFFTHCSFELMFFLTLLDQTSPIDEPKEGVAQQHDNAFPTIQLNQSRWGMFMSLLLPLGYFALIVILVYFINHEGRLDDDPLPEPENESQNTPSHYLTAFFKPADEKSEIDTLLDSLEANEKDAFIEFLEEKYPKSDFPSLYDDLTHELLRNPVSLITGHSFEKEAIRKWFADASTDPLTNTMLADKSLIENYKLKDMILNLLGSALREFHAEKRDTKTNDNSLGNEMALRWSVV